MEGFPILRFAEVTFPNLSIFWPMFNLNDFTRRFCDKSTLTEAFYDSESKRNLCTKFESPMTSLKKKTSLKKRLH